MLWVGKLVVEFRALGMELIGKVVILNLSRGRGQSGLCTRTRYLAIWGLWRKGIVYGVYERE